MKINLISNANRALSIFWLVAISLSIIGIAFAAAPNPGHDVTAVSGGAVQGDLFYGSAADTLLALPKNITATRYLSNTGASNNPAWAQVDLTNGVTGALPDGNISSAATWNAKMTNPMTTLGDIIYGGASGVATRLGGSAGFLKSTGAAAPAWSAVSLTADVSGILPTANGGTGMAFFTAAGPTVARIFTFPDAAATVLTSNAAVTVAQGGTGLGTLTTGNVILGAGTGNVTFVAPGTSGNVLTSNGSTWTSATGAGASYRTILQAAGSHIAARVAGTYGMGMSDPIAITGTGTLYPLAVIQIVAADYPTVEGITTKLRIRAQLYTNDVAPTGNYTFGLCPITRPATSGGAGLAIYTIGAAVTGSNGAVFTTPVADLLGSAVGADFALPADGPYVICVVTTATVATSAHIHMDAQLQMRNR